MATKAVLVAHSGRDPGVGSNAKVKIITRAHTFLSFRDAIAYMASSRSVPEYTSVAIGTMDPLTDKDYRILFGKAPPVGTGAVNTGKRRGGDVAGPEIFALRGNTMTMVDVGLFANAYTSVVLLACRGD